MVSSFRRRAMYLLNVVRTFQETLQFEAVMPQLRTCHVALDTPTHVQL